MIENHLGNAANEYHLRAEPRKILFFQALIKGTGIPPIQG
jgi:hypothetical protein